MCLANKPDILKSLLASKRKQFVCYKFLRYYVNTGKLCSYHHEGYVWQPGENKARGNCIKKPCIDRARPLHLGIHVYRTWDRVYHVVYNLINYVHTVCVAVKVIGKKADLLGAEDNELLFTKVYLSRREYNRALKTVREFLKNGSTV